MLHEVASVALEFWMCCEKTLVFSLIHCKSRSSLIHLAGRVAVVLRSTALACRAVVGKPFVLEKTICLSREMLPCIGPNG